MSHASMIALFLSKICTTSKCPFCAATCNGVLSTLVRASLLMPALIRMVTVSMWPCIAAKCRGDVPS